mgnify:CR=1 FL=1
MGFSPSSSKHFVIVALASPEPNELTRVLRRVRRRVYSPNSKNPEFKFRSSPERVRKAILNGVAETRTRIVWGGIIKHNTPTDPRCDKMSLYLLMCSRALTELTRWTRARSVHIVLDRCSNSRTMRANLGWHLREVASFNHAGYFAPSVAVSHLDSANSSGIQVADVVAGAVYRSLERSDPAYLRLISDNIVHGRLYW